MISRWGKRIGMLAGRRLQKEAYNSPHPISYQGGLSVDLPKNAYFQGKIVPYSEAKVGVATHALNYGTAVFGGIRGYRGFGGNRGLV
jgi:hypothetical protein